ncbi:DUF4440 domain-containing protein [Granulicella arctica]|uniref:DUF4440 domain-containing protein n=1 Tax=Granulicella arctica TaxID=940613 RepID=A0A7Y9PJ16_9BACT|nr:nuclear transport factor 2 family protein [Granulicella arctica]NYF80654.1 hypothetical protein [Granulicella arctica]
MSHPNQNLAAHLRQLEEQLFEPSTRRNPEALASLLADDFREFGSSGRIFTRQQIIDELATESSRRITLTDFHCQLLSPNIALVTYRSQRITDTEPPVEALRSSLWIERDNRWQVLFHQGTRI